MESDLTTRAVSSLVERGNESELFGGGR